MCGSCDQSHRLQHDKAVDKGDDEHMVAAHNALAWASCIVAVGLPIVMILAIKVQEDRDLKDGGSEAGLVDGSLYLRRYRFLWAALPMALFLLILVAVPIGTCGHDCYTSDAATLMLFLSLVFGLVAWALTISLIYNRYFHSSAERPYRFVNGGERWMLWSSRLLAAVSAALLLAALA